MNNKNQVIMKLFKSYLLEDNSKEKINIIDKEALKKRNLYK